MRELLRFTSVITFSFDVMTEACVDWAVFVVREELDQLQGMTNVVLEGQRRNPIWSCVEKLQHASSWDSCGMGGWEVVLSKRLK